MANMILSRPQWVNVLSRTSCHCDLIHVYSPALISIRWNMPSWLYTLACPSISHLGVYDVVIELLPDHSSPLSKLHTVTKWQKLKSFGNSLVAKWTTLGATMVRLFRLWIIFGDRFGHYCCGGPCLVDCIWRLSLDTLWWALPGWSWCEATKTNGAPNSWNENIQNLVIKYIAHYFIHPYQPSTISSTWRIYITFWSKFRHPKVLNLRKSIIGTGSDPTAFPLITDDPPCMESGADMMTTSVESVQMLFFFIEKLQLPAMEYQLLIHSECGWIKRHSMHMMTGLSLLVFKLHHSHQP